MGIHKLVLVCVDVRSAHNIGSFFRTCDGFDAELFIVGNSPRPHYDDDSRLPYVVKRAEKEIAKTALGAENHVTWHYAETLLSCINTLKADDFYVYGIEQDSKSKNIRDMNRHEKIALVVGREVDGLSLVEKKLCDELFEIPMSGKKESFNVSIAAGIALYEARR